MDTFDEAVIKFAQEIGVDSGYIYNLCGQDPTYRGYRDRHSVNEMLMILERVKNRIQPTTDTLHPQGL